MLTNTEITPQLRAGIAVRVAPAGSPMLPFSAASSYPRVVLGRVPAALG